MSSEIPSALQAYHPGVVHICQSCGKSVVDAVETPGEPFRCLDCRGLAPAPEDELTRAALADPGIVDVPADRPTLWRVVAVVVLAVGALGIVFWNR
ncbi:hypothetical protein [Geothrix sp. 21YS21S-4]|uniref:hypothetical protein n=1 Tax=Geothrix sp. 21YS21S-4 TaxID=3068889 RepID=UPI0027B91738|nr:hypothetical protein [Geothrix sp. 21YS21S-4]